MATFHILPLLCSLLLLISPVFSNYLGLISCKVDKECSGLKNATCIKGICQCSSLPFFVCEVETFKIVNEIGGKCSANKECNAQFSQCLSSGFCGCNDGMVSSLDKKICLPVVEKLGGVCLDSKQCSTSAPYRECRGAKCVCQSNSREKNGFCYKNIELGEKCVSHDDCFLINHAKCLEERCTCEATHFQSNATNSCLPIAHGIREECDENEQCSPVLGNGAFCSESEGCQCQELYHYKGSTKKCVRDLLLDENCAKHEECHQPGQGQSRLQCVEGVCKCRSIYQEHNGYCIEIVENGASSSSSSYRYYVWMFVIIWSVIYFVFL